MPVTKSCEQCGREYRVPPSRVKTSRFCCMACASAAKVIPIRKPTYKPKPGGLKCEICGEHYWALGVHVKHKHGISASEYKAEYGLLMKTPLSHAEICEAASVSIKKRLEDPEYRAESAERCRENGRANKGKSIEFNSPASSAAVAQRNRERNDRYLQARAKEVQKALEATGSIGNAAKSLRMARATVKRMLSRGLASIPAQRRAAC